MHSKHALRVDIERQADPPADGAPRYVEQSVAQCLSAFGAQHESVPVAISEAGKWRFRWPEEFDLIRQALHDVCDAPGLARHLSLIGSIQTHEGYMGEWWVTHLLTDTKLVLDELAHVVIFCSDDCRMFGRARLDQDAPARVGSSRPSRHLDEKVKGSFCGPKIWKAERGIGIENADEGHSWEVVAFGDHLCSDQDVDFAVTHPLYDSFALHPAAYISIEARDSRFRELSLKEAFHSLRAHTLLHEAHSLASGAALKEGRLKVAVVAFETCVASAMHRE